MSVTIGVGATQQLSYQLLGPLHGIGTPLWTSSNPGIATVNSVGTVTALAVGTTTITASLNGVSGTTLVTVSSGIVPQDGSLADVRGNIGDYNILRWADLTVGSTVALSGSNVTSVADPRGVGYGSPLLGIGGPGPQVGPIYDAVNLLATTAQDSQQYFQWPAANDLNMGQPDFWIAVIGASTTAPGNPFISWDDGSTGFGVNAQALSYGDAGTVFDKNGFHNPFNQVDSNSLFNANRTPSPSDRSVLRLFIVEKHYPTAVGTQQLVFRGFAGFTVYGAARMIWFNAGNTNSLGGFNGDDFAWQSGGAVVNFGRESGLNSVGTKVKAILCGTGVLTSSQRQSLWRYASRLGAVVHQTSNAVATVPTKVVTISHDSNSAGYGTTNTDTKAWPVLMQTALGSSYLVKQDGWAGTTAIDHEYWLSSITLPQINLQVQTRHIHIVGTQVTNDLQAVAGSNSAQRIIGALQDQCVQSKALGAKVLLFTGARAPSHDESNTPALATVNAWCRSAVANGYADDLYDIYTAIGASAGDPHFNDAQNAQIAVDVQAHVVALAA